MAKRTDNKSANTKTKYGRSSKSGADRRRNGRTKNLRENSDPKQSGPELEKRSNDPNWYFTDPKLADQVSQLSFQNLAGFPISYGGHDFNVPNIVAIYMNPAPGVQLSARYNTPLSQNSAMNMAGFRLYSKLAAFTGRVQNYAPQDVSMMILSMGELISMTEHIRRMFGVAYTMSMRNRDYPANVLKFGMKVDADDLFAQLSDYRTQFNTAITLINQLPIPKNIAYFQKCAAIYEKIYLDSPSTMAQTLVPIPLSTWVLDETSYSGGTILATEPVSVDSTFSWFTTPPTMAWYLNILMKMIGNLLNSSTLTVVYSDIMNYASKVSTEFWRMDYLFEDYQVIPTYDQNFLLQMHNATITNMPNHETQFVTSPVVVTPYNDVYPDANTNSIYYNPAFAATMRIPGAEASTGNEVLIDMLNDMPTLTDRVEVTRYSSITHGTPYQPTGYSGLECYIDTALPDHYIVAAEFEQQTNDLTNRFAYGTVMSQVAFPDIAAQISNIDWAPRVFEWNTSTQTFTGRYTSDVNFYTTVDERYLRKLHDFVGLALYDLR